jgi:hypothetical protein
MKENFHIGLYICDSLLYNSRVVEKWSTLKIRNTSYHKRQANGPGRGHAKARRAGDWDSPAGRNTPDYMECLTAECGADEANKWRDYDGEI